MKTNRRKVFLINRPFQLSILGWFSLLSLVLVGIFYSANWYFFYNFKNEAISAGLPPEHIFFIFLNEQKMVLNNIFLITSLIAVLVIVFGGLFLSHKVAGPLYRLTMHLKTHTKNNVPPLKLRKGDYFPEIQDSFNNFISSNDRNEEAPQRASND